MFRSRAFKSILPYLIAAGDLFLIVTGYGVAFYFRFYGHVPTENREPFIQAIPWIGLVTLLFFTGLGLYQFRRDGFTFLLRGVITGVLGMTVTTMALTFWFRGFAFPRSVFIFALPIQMVLVCAWRYFFWHLERWLYGRRKLLLVGNCSETEAVLNKLFNLPHGWFEIQYVLTPEDLTRLPSFLSQVDAVLVAPSLAREEKAIILSVCLEERREAYLVPDIYDILLSRSSMLQFDDLPVVEVQDIRLTWLQRETKRALDLALAGPGLLTSLPLMIVCALAIKATSPGPVFYLQKRVGYRGYSFMLYKFRTMIKDAEKITGPILSKEKDPRVTPVGRFLRSTCLDELPQLLNVIKGEMSIVGPRPERPFFVQQFTGEMPDYRYRYLVKPGLTGLAQVYGRYTTSAAEKLCYDLYYIRNYSIWLDLKIMLQTIPIALGGRGARGRKKEINPDKQAFINTLVNSAHQTAAGKEGQ